VYLLQTESQDIIVFRKLVVVARHDVMLLMEGINQCQHVSLVGLKC